jgi:hypothetical protein
MNRVQKELTQFDLASSLLARVTKALSCESIPLFSTRASVDNRARSSQGQKW